MNLGLALMEDSPGIRALREDTEEMRQIVETLLDAERMGSAHTVINRSDLLLPELAESLRQRFFPNESRLQIHVTGEPRARLDAARIQLLLKNLVGNALRYAPTGPVELTIIGRDGQVKFRVRDYGPGIPAEQRAHIGEPFYRSDASRARETGGTGLGLYLARQVARAHGGDLVLEESEGAGALFVATMPAA
jgi:signal transduction histidine kinase